MAYHFNDNVHTKSFTPREYQVELLDAAKERNIIICLGTGSSKIFIATKLIQELASTIRRRWHEGGKRTLFLADSAVMVSQHASYIRHLTDLVVSEHSALDEDGVFTPAYWDSVLRKHQVLVMTSAVCLHVLSQRFLQLTDINLLILDDCHRALTDHPMRQIMREHVAPCKSRPRVLGLTAPLLSSSSDPGHLEGELCRLEAALHCRAETASDIVCVLRYCSRPRQLVAQCAAHSPGELDRLLESVVRDARAFLVDHRYDPTEVYEDEFLEEIRATPDPKTDPLSVFDDFLHILHTLGAWCADRAALALLVQLEKLKVKTPYERHFLLLCMVSSVMVKIRAICEDFFQSVPEKERIHRFSSPKVRRLVEVLLQFKPDKPDPGESAADRTDCELEGEPADPSPRDGVGREAACSVKTLEKYTRTDSAHRSNCSGEDEATGINNNREVVIYRMPAKGCKECVAANGFSKWTCGMILQRYETSLSLRKHCRRELNGFARLLPYSNSRINGFLDSPIVSGSVFKVSVGNSNGMRNGIVAVKGVPRSELTSGDGDDDDDDDDVNLIIRTVGSIRLSLSTAHNPVAPALAPGPVCLGGKEVAGDGDQKTAGGSPSRRRNVRGARYARKGFAKDDGAHQSRPQRHPALDDPDALCSIVFVERGFTAKILYHMFVELRHSDRQLSFLSPQYTMEKTMDPVAEPREAEAEHRQQEEVLKRFRMRECNLLIATSVLEEGIDIPKCNLVVRFDPPSCYRAYVQSKGRARAPGAHYALLVEQPRSEQLVGQLAQYCEIERMLLRKCSNQEPPDEEEQEADLYTDSVEPYTPANSPTNASVNLATAIALVNRYCAKLPSDTFTRLTPLCAVKSMVVEGTPFYQCVLRLPINSPVKQEIVGAAVPSRALARRLAALEACRVLHRAKELDDNLLPIGKESFRVQWEEECGMAPDEEDSAPRDPLEPRPGTTKRRQYYNKRIATALTDCRPTPGRPSFLYHVGMVLTCPLPEEQNTRGRKIYPPEDSPQGFGILTLKPIPKICPFPIFTRSGEVRVTLDLCDSAVVLCEEKLDKIIAFLNYTFTGVLRLQKYLMLFDPQASENSYFIVPTVRKAKEERVEVDWQFLDRIYMNRDLKPQPVPEEEREGFQFDANKYYDAVIMPWYRNQDQPQYFYVAEICTHLSPKSAFPGSEYKTFDEYYFKKYGIHIQNSHQPLLDVDHTSARLNFLTPRYVNRKGVALPTSSEATKRAKRENLEQKQILVPELCTVHPFPASLWRKAVCLPCVLYRVNALLLADQVRCVVAADIGLGSLRLPPDFQWAPLDFGWSLADVLRKSRESHKAAPVPLEDKPAADPEPAESEDADAKTEEREQRREGEEEDGEWMEIGTWSNDMAASALGGELPPGTSASDHVRYASPTSWLAYDGDGYDSDDDSSYGVMLEYEHSEASEVQGTSGIRIEFKGDVAEAVDDDAPRSASPASAADVPWDWDAGVIESEEVTAHYASRFQDAVAASRRHIEESGMVVRPDQPVIMARPSAKFSQKEPEERRAGSPPVLRTAEPPGDDCELDSGVSEKAWPDHGSASSLSSLDDSCFALDDELLNGFSFDGQPELLGHPGPSPSIILQALTMSNANDGINLERLETIGDSFLKYAITTYLYCTYDSIHEGKLSHLRSKQVSNLNLYRLGRRKVFGESMIATKFEPHDNWLPPCYYVPRELEQALIEAGVPASHWNQADLPALRELSREEICRLVQQRSEALGPAGQPHSPCSLEALPCFIPYNLITQHSIPDKSVADCVEALIGAYLIACGPRGALLFMAWLGICVLPQEGSDGKVQYGTLSPPPSPLLRHVRNPEADLESLLDGYDVFERRIGYMFRDRSYLLQALTHASYSPNRLTDCYQRLEFLGDAVLDYLITRHLYEDSRQHSPGALTDLRSALVNNTIFASLAVRHGFHKYFRHLSPGLGEVVDRFVRIQEENGHTISEEYYLIEEDECEEAEDVEVPKALGDVFESVAGAIFMDSGMSLDAVWRVYYFMMKTEIEQFSTNVPKSPIRELLELEPETAKFGKPEKLADGRRVRVTVEVFGKGSFKGIGRNYRIAKCTAAKCALKQLKKKGLLSKKLSVIGR
ncbi:endoribonuclease Dcr-1 isoform X2 [Bacillus rossius redtenbacheri]